MYDRAPRNVSNTIGSTVEHVGPGTYDSDALDHKKLRADGYAPFLSMTSRESFLKPTDTVIAAPGPGQYDPGFPQENITGGRMLANKGKRFEDIQSDTPGPGSYTLSKKTDWLKEQNAMGAPDVKGSAKSGILLTNRVKFHRRPVAPAIPCPGQAYGYEEDEDGTLVKQSAPQKDKSMGPAFYNVMHDDTVPTVLYKGIHFGRMTSRRMDFGGKEGPGPGEYEPFNGQKQYIVEHVNMEAEDTKFDAKLPRYHELVVIQEEKKAVPGPGKYHVRGMFDPMPPTTNTEGIEVEHPPFGSQAKRFGPMKNENPSPGSYNDPRSALDGMKRISGLKRSPFGQTSVRFVPTHHIKKTPGPGTYHITGMGSDSMKRAYIESTRRGVFGTTAVRINPMTKKETQVLPGPAHYQVKEKPFEPRYQQLSSNFASLSQRLTETPSVVRDIPPPGSYNISNAYSKTQGKVTPGAPRTESGKRKQGAFQASSSRFAPPRDVVLEETDPSNPGPGTYNARLRLDTGNQMTSKDGRFRSKKSDVPGPGTYEFSPLIQDTVLKGTFNATLNNPIAQQLDMVRVGSTAKHPFLLGV